MFCKLSIEIVTSCVQLAKFGLNNMSNWGIMVSKEESIQCGDMTLTCCQGRQRREKYRGLITPALFHGNIIPTLLRTSKR